MNGVRFARYGLVVILTDPVWGTGAGILPLRVNIDLVVPFESEVIHEVAELVAADGGLVSREVGGDKVWMGFKPGADLTVVSNEAGRIEPEPEGAGTPRKDDGVMLVLLR